MRAVFDTNVIVSAALSPHGAPATAVRGWIHGAHELVTSPKAHDELRRVLAYPKLRRYITASEAEALLAVVEFGSIVVDDPVDLPQVRSSDPDDDYLIALAAETRSVIVTGDANLLALSDLIPVFSPAEFVARWSH